MLIVDLIIVAIVALAGVWGFRGGLTLGVVALIGFGGGALLGSRVAPLILHDGVHSTYAPILALPGALLFGGVLASGLELLGARLSKRRRGRPMSTSPLLDDVGGPLLAACAGLVGVWLVAAALVQSSLLSGPLRESTILQQLNAVLPPAGPLVHADVSAPPVDPFSQVNGPRPEIAPANPKIKSDPDVRAAARSVVKLVGLSCGNVGSGSGWVVAPGIVVTNAHVVADVTDMTAQVGGKGRDMPTTTIWFDPKQDVALLRVPGLARARALRLVGRAKSGTAAAILGFPLGGPYNVQVARIGPTLSFRRPSSVGERGIGGGGSVPSTTMLGRSRPGNSGGPVVDSRGQVLTMIWGGSRIGLTAYGITADTIRTALKRSGAATGGGRPVATGRCH